MQTLSEIRQLLADRGLKPKHRLGQNFLHDKNQLTKLVDAADIKPGDLVLEIGPGTGTLTSALLEAGAEVIACELDRDMAAIIRDQFADRMTSETTRGRGPSGGGSLRLVEADCLAGSRELNPAIVEAINGRTFKLAANLPYQIASPLMSALLQDHLNCVGQFVTIQKEVAERLMAKPSTKAYGPLSIIVQAFAEVERLATLSPSCFWPPPEVTSAMVAIRPRTGVGNHFSGADDKRDFARFVTELFTKRRKQLGTVFGRQRTDWPAGITPDLRPEALTVEQCIALWRVVAQERSTDKSG